MGAGTCRPRNTSTSFAPSRKISEASSKGRPASAKPFCACAAITCVVRWLTPSLRAATVVWPIRSDSIRAVSMSLTPNATSVAALAITDRARG